MYMPFYVQGAIGASATSSGFVIMPMTVSMVIASALSGQIVTRTGKYKKLSLAGLSMMVAGLLLAANMNPHTPIVIGALNMILVGIGLGIALPIYISTTQNAVKNEQLGIATAAFQMSRQFGGTIGVAVLGIIMNNRLTLLINQLFSTSAVVNFWEKEPALAETMVVMRDPQILMDAEKLARIKVALPSQFEETFLYLLQSLRSALSSSLNTIFVIMAAVILVAFLIGLFLEEIPLRSINKSE
jgi:MFS family permease